MLQRMIKKDRSQCADNMQEIFYSKMLKMESGVNCFHGLVNNRGFIALVQLAKSLLIIVLRIQLVLLLDDTSNHGKKVSQSNSTCWVVVRLLEHNKSVAMIKNVFGPPVISNNYVSSSYCSLISDCWQKKEEDMGRRA